MVLLYGYCICVDCNGTSLSVGMEIKGLVQNVYLKLRIFSISDDRNVMEISTISTHIKRPGCSQFDLAVEFNG